MRNGTWLNRLPHILLIEDNADDLHLTQEAFARGKTATELHTVTNGISAMAFLRKEPPYQSVSRPDLILLDLHLPDKDGLEVLAEIKSTPELASIPVIILTQSDAKEDILKTYDLHANGYIIKPVEVDQFYKVFDRINDFWFSIALLPPNDEYRP